MRILILLPALVSSLAMGNDKTVPFIIPPSQPLFAIDWASSQATQMANSGGKKAPPAKHDPTAFEIPYTDIAELLKKIRTTLCDVNTGGEFKVWIGIDVATKVLGIGTSANGGIEAKVICKAEELAVSKTPPGMPRKSQ